MQFSMRRFIVLCAIVVATTHAANEIYLEGIEEPLATLAERGLRICSEKRFQFESQRLLQIDGVN